MSEAEPIREDSEVRTAMRRGAGVESRMSRLRELGAKVWKPVLGLISAALAGVFTLKEVGVIPKDFPSDEEPWQRWTVIGFAVFLLLCIRFPVIADWVTRLIVGPVDELEIKKQVFLGLASYREKDAERFFGRDAEREALLRLLEDKACVVVEGESGCGKSSLLQTLVVPALQREGKVFRCRPGSRPFASVLSALREGAEEAAGEEASAENWWQALGAPVKAGPPPVLFVDQFEELFAMVPEMERKRFFSALHEGVKMRWFRLLVAIRSDFADLLARGIRKADPEREGLGQAEYQEIEAFSERRALSVLNQMLEPLYRDHPTLQGQLENFAQAVVEDLLRPPRDRRRSRADEKTLLPVELQTVGMILEQRGPDAFSAAAYHELGGKLGLYRSFLDRAKQQIWRKTLVSEEQALLVLRQLISASRTKIPRSAEEVAKAVGLKERQVEEVLSEYGRMFLVRLLPAEAGTAKAARYDLMHEHLIEILVEAPEPALQKARDAEERLRFWTARATGAWEIPVGGKTRWEQVRDRVATWFRVRLPLTESLRLRKYATKGSEARQIVNLNLRGFAMRGCVLLAVVMLAWSVTWTDAYQIRQLVAETRPEKADRAGEGRYALIWDLALFKAGRIEELKTAARAIQGAGNAWNDYRPEALGLAALGASLVGDTEGVKEMVKRAAADLELEPELKGSNGNREEFTWTTTTNRLVVFCARALKEAGDEKGAKDLLRKFADRFWSNGNIAAGVLPGVVEVLKQCDLAEEVPEILETAVRLIQIEWEGEKSKADLLLAAAGEFARIGNAKRADEVLEQAAAVKETFDVDVLLAATSGFAAVDQRRAAKVLRQYALMAGRDGELNFFKVDPIDPRIRIALTLHGYQDNATAAKVLNTVLKREGPKKVLPNGNEPAKEQDGAGVGTDEGAVEDGISYPFTDSLRSRVALLKAWKVISPSEGWQELEEAVKKELQQVINEAKGRLAGDAGVEEGGDNPAERSARFANAAAGAIEWGREEDGELLLKAAEKAEDEIDEASQIEGEGATSLIEVAECYARLGQFRKARQVVKRCSSHERLEAAAAVLTEYAVDTGLSQKFQFGVPMSESIPPSPPGP